MALADYLPRPPAVRTKRMQNYTFNMALQQIEHAQQVQVASLEAFEALTQDIQRNVALIASVEHLTQLHLAKPVDAVGFEHYQATLSMMFQSHGLLLPKQPAVSLEDSAVAVQGQAGDLAAKALAYVKELVAKAVAKVREFMERESQLSEKVGNVAKQAVARLRQVKDGALSAFEQGEKAQLPGLMVSSGHPDLNGAVERFTAYFADPSPLGKPPVFKSLASIQDPQAYKDGVVDAMDALTKQEETFNTQLPALSDEERQAQAVKGVKVGDLLQLSQQVERLANQRTNYMQNVYNSHSQLIVADTKRYAQINPNKDTLQVTDALKLSGYRFNIESIYQRVSTRLNDELVLTLKALAPYANLATIEA